ncbi:MAG: glutamate--tRNA ligase [Spirochaeta sp.]|nr:glutamate--tRNA ligase [Spirochaeta sp.]
MNVRVRYAPSPTGLQHIGGIRTALFNYLFARSLGGKFILRIEDTDRERFDPTALQDIYDSFSWLGIHWDEGPNQEGPHSPYFQSERQPSYEAAAHALIETGHAYECFCTADRLETMRAEQTQGKSSVVGYDRRCRDLSKEDRERLRSENPHPVVRFKTPLEGDAVFEDLLLGRVKRKNKDISPDPVLLKSDRFPTYHLANVVDDHTMEISHVLRAQEWLPSTALHILLYRAFGWETPVFCHLPMVMGKDGQKLSKRHGATSLIEFRRRGYLPEAVINYVALLGWAYDDSREFFTLDELETLFDANKLNKAPSVFDYTKLDWFNGNYIRDCDDTRLLHLITPFLEEAGIRATGEQLKQALPLIRERMKRLEEAPQLLGFLLGDPAEYPTEDLIPKKMDVAATVEVLEGVLGLLEGLSSRSDEENEERFRLLAEQLETKLGNVLMPLRVAVTGSKVSPPLFGSIKLLGEDKARVRVGVALQKLKSTLGEE